MKAISDYLYKHTYEIMSELIWFKLCFQESI